MAYPRYISKGAFQSGTGALTVPALTGTQAGDIIILFAESANQTINTPTGYSVLATQIGTGTAAAAGGVRIASFYRILEDAADTSTSVADSGDHTTAIKMLFRDTSLADGAFFVTATSTQAATTAMVFPAVTTATDESLVVLAVGQDTDAASTATVGTVTNANLTSITERHDQTVTAGVGGGLAVITGQKATAGNTGTSTATGSTSVTHAYHTISLSRVAAQTTTSTFNTVAGTSYFPISDAMRITAGTAGTISATSSGTFQPNTLTNGTYALNFKWYWRQYGTDAWTSSTAVASTVSAVVTGGVLDTTGTFTDNETITGLTNAVEYEVVLFAARASGTPANTISFSATATIAIPAAPKTITADAGSFSYSGNNANVLFDRAMVADTGSFAYSGNDATLTYVGGINNYTITADAGSFTYSGNNANVLFNRKVVADAGAYTYSGNAANVLLNRRVIAEAGGYTYAGNNANTIYNRRVVAEPASFTYSGNNAGLLFNRKVVADTGSFSYSGNAANLIKNSRIVAEEASYALSGANAALVYARKLVADTGSYSFSGQTADLIRNRIITADAGSYTLTGQNATLTYLPAGVYLLGADGTTYTLTGTSATLTYSGGSPVKVYIGTALLDNGGISFTKIYVGTTQVF